MVQYIWLLHVYTIQGFKDLLQYSLIYACTYTIVIYMYWYWYWFIHHKYIHIYWLHRVSKMRTIIYSGFDIIYNAYELICNITEGYRLKPSIG